MYHNAYVCVPVDQPCSLDSTPRVPPITYLRRPAGEGQRHNDSMLMLGFCNASLVHEANHMLRQFECCLKQAGRHETQQQVVGGSAGGVIWDHLDTPEYMHAADLFGLGNHGRRFHTVTRVDADMHITLRSSPCTLLSLLCSRSFKVTLGCCIYTEREGLPQMCNGSAGSSISSVLPRDLCWIQAGVESDEMGFTPMSYSHELRLLHHAVLCLSVGGRRLMENRKGVRRDDCSR